MPLPLRTSTFVCARASLITERCGRAGGGAVSFGAGSCFAAAGFAAADFRAPPWTCGATWRPIRTSPATTSSTSSTAAIPLATSVAVRHGRTSSVCARGCSTADALFVPPQRPPSLRRRLDPVPGAPQPVLERDLRPPAELALRERHVERAAQHVAFAWHRHQRLAGVARHRPAALVQL